MKSGNVEKPFWIIINQRNKYSQDDKFETENAHFVGRLEYMYWKIGEGQDEFNVAKKKSIYICLQC